MAKTMARIQNGVVINLEWVDDKTPASDDLKNVYDLLVEIGDTYENNKFYRDGLEVISFRKEIQNAVAGYDSALSDIEAYVTPVSTFSFRSTRRNLTIEERKQSIVANITDMLTALETLGVTPDEQGRVNNG